MRYILFEHNICLYKNNPENTLKIHFCIDRSYKTFTWGQNNEKYISETSIVQLFPWIPSIYRTKALHLGSMGRRENNLIQHQSIFISLLLEYKPMMTRGETLGVYLTKLNSHF